MPVVQRRNRRRTDRLPVLGTIRLGDRVPYGNKGDTRPQAREYFVLRDAQAVAEVYGPEPTVLEPVIIPVDDEEVVASDWLRHWTQTWGLTCKGDGEMADRLVDSDHLEKTGEPKHADHDTKRGQWVRVSCPCYKLEDGDCKEQLFLNFVLPDVPGLGIWRLATGSRNSIDNVLGCLKMIRTATRSPKYPDGRVSGIPLRLSLVPKTVVTMGDEKTRGGKKTVRVLQLELAQQVKFAELVSGQANINYAIGALAAPMEEGEAEESEAPPKIELRGDQDYQKVYKRADELGIEREHEVPLALRKVSLMDFFQDGHSDQEAIEALEEYARNRPSQPSPSEEVTKALDHNDVYKLARDLGYQGKVPQILGTREKPVKLPDWIAAGGTYEGAIRKVREYYRMDKGEEPPA